LEVRFKHPLLGDYKEYERVLRCPVWFDQQEDSLTFGRDAVNRAVPSANEQLAVMLDDMAVQNLAGLSGRFSAKVRESLLKQFAVGDVSKHRTAECMHMTERTLLRRLREEGTTFRDVLDELREELAYKYMKKPDATVEEVSALLGFSDASTFSRAFKRWTGRRPSCVRQDFLDLNNAEVVPPL
ncbi:MAG: AraC family transcriptional regulator, partial [Sinobacteraceae bacterium]|nr:AraC family transcriptional regulator [Nevskiaceae bacterium]